MSETFKQDKLKDFTIIRNSIFKDYRLSAKAKGVACQLLSLPPTWDYSVRGLTTLFNDGEASIRSALSELEEAGYLRREQVREGGKFGKSVYVITDMLKSEKPCVENPLAENSTAENPTQLNTNISTTYKSKTKDIYEGLPENLKETLYEFEEMRKSIKKPMTDVARKRLIRELQKLAGENVQQMIQILD
ncbi:MAG: hypothetical protein II489_00320, partial [Bacteroidaceae bacterium]|nr:hypothetical protein [Bacteroidaceae bacterium]